MRRTLNIYMRCIGNRSHHSWNPLCLPCCCQCSMGTGCHLHVKQSRYLSLPANPTENSLKTPVMYQYRSFVTAMRRTRVQLRKDTKFGLRGMQGGHTNQLRTCLLSNECTSTAFSVHGTVAEGRSDDQTQPQAVASVPPPKVQCTENSRKKERYHMTQTSHDMKLQFTLLELWARDNYLQFALMEIQAHNVNAPIITTPSAFCVYTER